jgi:fucokinase
MLFYFSIKPISLTKADETKRFKWIQVSCPARLDLAGAWSDTPPITYDSPNGSCVTNVAILVNGKKPIGCKGRIISQNDRCFIKVIMQNSSNNDEEPLDQTSVVFYNLSDFKDYNKPQSLACLVKAVCVFTKLVDLDERCTLDEQLNKKLNGCLELRTWTGLPQGDNHEFVFLDKNRPINYGLFCFLLYFVR